MARMAAWLACDREISMAAVARMAARLACDREISMVAVARIAVWLACDREISMAAVARMARIAARLIESIYSLSYLYSPTYIVLFV